MRRRLPTTWLDTTHIKCPSCHYSMEDRIIVDDNLGLQDRCQELFLLRENTPLHARLNNHTAWNQRKRRWLRENTPLLAGLTDYPCIFCNNPLMIQVNFEILKPVFLETADYVPIEPHIELYRYPEPEFEEPQETDPETETPERSISIEDLILLLSWRLHTKFTHYVHIEKKLRPLL